MNQERRTRDNAQTPMLNPFGPARERVQVPGRHPAPTVQSTTNKPSTKHGPAIFKGKHSRMISQHSTKDGPAIFQGKHSKETQQQEEHFSVAGKMWNGQW